LKLANLLPPVFICLVVGTILSVYTALHLASMLQFDVPGGMQDSAMARRGLWQAVVSGILVSFFLVCYAKAVLTKPGAIPDTPEWRLGPQGGMNQWTVESNSTGERRRCKWCVRYKPDRCHHCRVCKTCVLKMDHHCPWIMNCVGWGNHKYFFLLVIYSCLSCLFIFVTGLESAQASMYKDMPHSHRFVLVFGLMLSLIMGSLMTIFLSFHVWMMLQGMTTIEFCEKAAGGAAAREGKPSYDQGAWENVLSVLGPRPWLWLLPLDPALGDGIHHRPKALRDSRLPQPTTPLTASTTQAIVHGRIGGA